MRTYAGIGSRKLSNTEQSLCHSIGFWMAERGWTLHTGAAEKADQSFAEGAFAGGGKVVLHLPWRTYEQDWVCRASALGAEIQVLPRNHTAAFNSVPQFHPNPNALTRGMRALHARNFLIISQSAFIIAWPIVTWPAVKANKNLGGTGQGIRIAEGLHKTVIRLDIPEVRQRVESKVLQHL